MKKINYNKISFYASYGIVKQLPESSIPEIVFIGKSNVGKSSLLNKLCNNKKLAKVSSMPGKTSTINFFDAQICFFVDMPGYGYAKKSNDELSRWHSLMGGYFADDRNIPLICFLHDIRRDATISDIDTINYVKNLAKPFMIVFTKSDKLSKQQSLNSKSKFLNLTQTKDYAPNILTSALTGLGISELRNHIHCCL